MPEVPDSLDSAEMARSFAERIFSKYPNTTESLKWLKENGAEFITRVVDFNAVVAKLNEVIENPSSVNEQYRGEIDQLVSVAGGHIPMLQEAEFETNEKFRHSPALKAFFQGKREFGWADEEYDPNRPARSAMGIFLEGYGRYVGLRLTKEPEQVAKIQKAFVYAFEAVLLAEHPNSELLGDIREWIKGDADKFSEPIRQLLK
ncbi:MAG: hypothetical protein G01um10145_821 [Microgenomates group bacterium Gr01-1014_5]|nr:MAG: hypothetical protein G01um10145_821 [Microgenomates group bacterium Gr01-1014_5]